MQSNSNWADIKMGPHQTISFFKVTSCKWLVQKYNEWKHIYCESLSIAMHLSFRNDTSTLWHDYLQNYDSAWRNVIFSRSKLQTTSAIQAALIMLLTLLRLLPRCSEIFKWSLGVSPPSGAGNKRRVCQEGTFHVSLFTIPRINGHEIIREFSAITCPLAFWSWVAPRRIRTAKSNSCVQ